MDAVVYLPDLSSSTGSSGPTEL